MMPRNPLARFQMDENDQSLELEDLIAAAVSSTDFWDNPEDDEDWNNA
jgi:hypothetical protein